MPNRRQRIKYEGLNGYRMREKMRRMKDGLMMDDMRAYREGMYPGTLGEMTMQNQPLRHDPYMPRDYGMNDYARRESDYARREQDMRGRQGGRRNDYGSGEPYAGVPAFYEENDMARGYRRTGYGEDMARGYDRAGKGYGYDGHYPLMEGHKMTYYPVEAMGKFNGYYGMNEPNFARGNRRNDYAMYNDYGETLSEEEMEHWCKKLKSQLDEREKQMFSKEAIEQHAKRIGRAMEGFSLKELELTTLMIYTDYKNSIGQNLDLAVRLAFDWLNDKDAAVKGAEKLAIYHDCIIEGDE